MRKLRGGACLTNDLDLSLTGPSGADGSAGTTASTSRSGCSSLGQGQTALWADASLSFGEWEDSSFAEELDHASRAITLGLDRMLSDRAIGGLAMSYGRDVTDVGSDGSETKTESLGLAVYVTYDLGGDFYVDGTLGAARLDFTSRRWIATEGQMARGERDGRQVFFSVAAGKSFGTEAQPMDAWLRLSGSRSTLEAFTETGAASVLSFAEQDVESLVGSVGFSTSYEIRTATGLLRPSFTGELNHEFSDPGVVGVSYAGIVGGTLYTRDAASRERTDLTLGLGFDFLHASGWQLEADLGARLDGDGVASTDLKLNWRLDF